MTDSAGRGGVAQGTFGPVPNKFGPLGPTEESPSCMRRGGGIKGANRPKASAGGMTADPSQAASRNEDVSCRGGGVDSREGRLAMARGQKTRL